MTASRPNLHRPALVFLALGIALLLAFAGWSALVLSGATDEFDRELSARCAEHANANSAFRLLMVVATHSGGKVANIAIALGGALWMWRHHRRRFAFAWLIIAIVYGLMIYGLKEFAGRERPAIETRDASVVELINESYPSGHAMGGLVGYGMLGFVVMQRVKRWPQRLAIGTALAIWIVLIGFSRIYLRAHWGSDVVGGWLLGMGYVNICLAVYFWRSRGASGTSAAWVESNPT